MKKRLLSLLLCVAMLCAMFPSPALADDEEPTEPTLYTVTFDTDGGSEIDPQKIEAGGLVARPDDPEKEHYSFADWYKEDTLENKWDFDADTVTEDITLYAAWEIDTFEVIFMDGETVVLTTAADYGATLTAPELDAKEHYTLTGWQDADGVYWDFENDTVTDDVILFAVWAIDTFEVTFMDGEDVIKSAVVDYGTKLTAPALGEKEHYTLTGWQDADGVYWDFDADVVTTDLTLYAVWAIDTFDVTYFVDGAPYQSLTVDYGTLLTAPDDPEKEHYTFDGWFTAEDEKWDFATPIESDLSLYAKFSPIEFTVTFNSNGGSDVAPVTVLEGNTIEAPADPEKSDCTFAGWYKDEAFAEAWDFENDTVNANITLYARWELNACTVTFMADGEVYETGVYHYGDKIEAPAAPEKAHYIFDGWYKESTLETRWDFETDTVTADITLYAAFSPEEYTVAFTVEGVTIKTVTVTYGEKVSAPETPSKEHYTFEGWFTEEDVLWNFDSPVESNLILSAKFAPILFTVTFDSVGGSEVSPVTVLEGSTIEAPADPEKAHYTFLGWYKEAALETKWDFEADAVTSDITLYAGWQVVAYTVTYMVDGEEYTSVSADYATLLSAPTAPEKEHYTFEGWFTAEDAKWDFEKDTVEDNTVLYARFAPETYDVTLHTDGGIIAEGKEITSYVYGEGAVLPTASEIAKTGHDFLGWYDNADLVGDQVTAISEEDFGAKEFFAKWAPCVYDVTFVLNGGEIVEGEFASYVFGNEVALPTDVVRTGYTFRGWFDNADFEGSPVTRITSEDTGDKTFYACWEANVYALSFELNGGAADGELPDSYTYGEDLTLPTGLSRFGYTFAGWYDNADFEGSPVTSVTPTDLGDKTFYAAWTANIYPVRLHINYGDSIKEGKDITSYTYDTEVMLPAADDLIAQGEWTFAGWYRDNGTFKIGPVEKITSSEVTEATTILNYYAKWITSSYQISYVLNGGEIRSGLVTAYTFGEGTLLPTDVVRTGYTFAGWYTNAAFEGSPVTRITSEDTGDKIFYARWTANVYQVTLNAMGGTIAEGKDITSYTYDTEVLLPTAEDMTRTGYTFAGWYADANYSGEAVTAIFPGAIGNQTYFARWNALVFSVTLHYDEDAALSFQLTSYTYGVGAVLPAVTRTGYVFEGWFETAGFEGSPVTSIAADSLGDLEFFAKLTPAVYSITLVTNGGTVNSGLVTSYTYGEGAILPTDITRNGYKFLGWYGASDFSGEAITEVGASETGNKTFYARWDPHTYQVTLETNGGSIAEGRDVTFYICGVGAVLPTAEAVTRTGYKFGGWYKNADFSGNAVTEITREDYGDKTFYAKWTQNDYAITYVTGGGTINDADYATGYKFGVGAVLPTDVTRTGYEFTGWYKTSDCAGTPVTEVTTTDTGDKTFYAGWKACVYLVTLDANGGIIASGKDITSYTYGIGAALPTAADMSYTGGYVFGGWYATPDFSDRAVTSISATDLGDKVFYAKWDMTVISVPRAVTGLTYNGSEQIGVPSGTGYLLAGNTATNAGTYTATATLLEGYTWNNGELSAREITWSIAMKMVTLSSSDIAIAYKTTVYDGTEKTPAVTAVKDGSATVEASEYTVVYSANINAGTATVTIADVEGGNYYISGHTTFTIEKRALTISGIRALDKVYDGTAHADVDLSGVVYGNKVEGDELSIDVVASFVDAEVGENKAVTLTVSITGAKADNYVLSEDSQTASSATIRRYILFGDANRDGIVNSDDSVLILRFSVEIISASDIDWEACDVSADGKVLANDASMILRYLVGLISEFPAKN